MRAQGSFQRSLHLRIALTVLLVALALTREPLPKAWAASPDPSRDEPQIAANLRLHPLSFESNEGQTDEDVRFLSHGPAYSILFKDREADLLLTKERSGGEMIKRPSTNSHRSAQREADFVKMQLQNAGSPVLTGEIRLPGTVNYFLGNDPAKWHTAVPTFDRVRYAGVYPGIDLVYYGNQERLEFDFEVTPGADPKSIRIRFDGARKLTVDREGDLEIVAPNGKIRLRKPAIYQLDAGNKHRVVAGSLRITAGKMVSFNLGKYDKSKPLVIDPILDYSTYLGQVGEANAIAVDSAGDAYVTGWAEVGMPTTPGAIQTAPVTKSGSATESAFVAKFNSTGTALLYCTYLSGSGDDVPVGIAVDGQGNAYIAGQTTSVDFPTTPGAFQSVNADPPNSGVLDSVNGSGFITKINSTGTALVYSTYLGGSAASFLNGLAVDASGNAYVTGETGASDFPTTKGAFQTSVTNSKTAFGTGFVTKLNTTGTGLVYSTFLGGSTFNPNYGAEDYGDPTAIALDDAGNAYITGSTAAPDFPITPGAYQSTYKSAVQMAFVTKLNPAGTGLVYSTYLGGTSDDEALAIGVDSSGDAYLTGFTQSTDFPTTPGAFQPTLSALINQGAFVTKLNASGTALAYSTFLAGEYTLNPNFSVGTGTAIAVDPSGDAYVTGNTDVIDFPVTAEAFEPVNRSQLVTVDYGSFMTELDPTGSQLLYSTYLSGSGNGASLILNGYGSDCDCANGIALDSSNNVYVAGYTASIDFPITQGAFQTSNTSAMSGNVAFVTEFNGSEMKPLPATMTSVTSSASSVLPYVPVTFTATVQGIPGGSTPTGVIAFNIATGPPNIFPMAPWQIVDLNGSGSASYTTSALQAGQNPINAYYLGDANNAASTGALTENTLYFPTVTTVAASAATAAYGAGITFTATVLESSGNPAKGTVFFKVGNIIYLNTVLDANGQATWSSSASGSFLPAGTDTVTVEFIESADDQASSGSVTVTITPLGVTQTPTFSPPAGTYNAAQQVALNDASSGAEIYFTTNGSAPVVGASGQLPAGYTIQVNTSQTVQAIAVAPGYSASSVASATYVINPPIPDFGLTLSPGSLTINSGGTGTSTVGVTAIDGFSGTVSFVCSGLPAGASCSFSPSSVTGSGASTLSVDVPGNTSSIGSPARFPFAPLTSVALTLGWISLRRRLRSVPLLIVVLVLALSFLTACGSGGAGGGGGRNQTTSTVTVTATSGSLSHTATFTLTLN